MRFMSFSVFANSFIITSFTDACFMNNFRNMCALLKNVLLVLGKNRDELLQLIIY